MESPFFIAARAKVFQQTMIYELETSFQDDLLSNHEVESESENWFLW